MVAGAKEDLLTLRGRMESENRDELLVKLPAEVWEKIVDENVQQNDLLALAMTCRFFRDTTKELGKEVETNLGEKHLLQLLESGRMLSHSMGWFRWVCDTFEILPGSDWGKRVKGTVYEGSLLHYAAFQGSVEILRWLMEEKGWKLTLETGEWAGMGGSIEVLEYVRERGCKFDEYTCQGAARGGCLEALKFLRGLDPPCPWNEWTCTLAAEGGHLDILKWARSQDPPCPWDDGTCVLAAQEGHLEVLKWLRSEAPPWPWPESTCSYAAKGGQLEVLKWLRAEEPPYPWDEWTCAKAAEGGHLEVLKWLRAEEPPCPWSRSDCRKAAVRSDHQYIVDWIDQQEED